MVLATGGHVDHGKTSLVKALTGIDTDRLPEEKARAISIELGFAHLIVDGRAVDLIDVPGHERFVRAMLTGATGADAALLVVAADEGVMPQTREHLDVFRLLGVTEGLVALTKIDRVDRDCLELAADEAREAVRGVFRDDPAPVPCSVRTGEGIEPLTRALATLVGRVRPRPADGPFRLPVDRAFTVKGIGTVVTGTVASGCLEANAPVIALPGTARGRARTLEVRGARRRRVRAGERAAINLHGIEHGQLKRGQVIGGEELVAVTRVEASLTLLPICPGPLRDGARLLLSALTTQENATVRLLDRAPLQPGDCGLVRLTLDRPAALLPGNRFVLRGFRALAGHGTCLAGGTILRTAAGRPRADAVELLRSLPSGDTRARVRVELEAAAGAPVAASSLRGRLPDGAAAIGQAFQRLAHDGDAELIDEASQLYLATSALPALGARVQALLRRGAGPDDGLDREELRASFRHRGWEPRPFAALINRLARAGFVTLAGSRTFLATGASRASVPDGLDDAVAAALSSAGLAPPSPEELAATLRSSPEFIRRSLTRLTGGGLVVRIKHDLYMASAPVGRLRARLREHLLHEDQISTEQFKALTGQSRKYAIPLAEFFDDEKITLRVGNLRRPRRGPA